MASEYLKWKYRDVRPEKPLELTKKQRRQNWWHYHKWHVLIGVAVVLIGADWGWNILTRVTPDYQIAYVGSVPLSEGDGASWETQLAAFGTDCNGDGKVVVQLKQYLASYEDAMYNAAANVRLLADLDGRESYFFLLEDRRSSRRIMKFWKRTGSPWRAVYIWPGGRSGGTGRRSI